MLKQICLSQKGDMFSALQSLRPCKAIGPSVSTGDIVQKHGLQKASHILVLVKVEGAGHSGQPSAQGGQHGAQAAMVHHHAALLHPHSMVYKSVHRLEPALCQRRLFLGASFLQGLPLPCSKQFMQHSLRQHCMCRSCGVSLISLQELPMHHPQMSLLQRQSG